MYLIYELFVHIAASFAGWASLFHPKLKLFVNGRTTVFSYLEKNIRKGDRLIWVHCASLGEFEQGLPLIERLKSGYPKHNILVTFFSPSGYEVKKKSTDADFITYLPLDTYRNANRFLDIAHPELAIFIKYEIWPNYLRVLNKKGIPTLLVSGIFRKEQVFFKWYGRFMRKALTLYAHIFVQDDCSRDLLNTIKISGVTVNGDTRLDRVSEILERDNTLPFMEQFAQGYLCFVAGSTWPEDEAIIVDYINQNTNPLKYVIAPHTIKFEKVAALKKQLQKKTLLFTEIPQKSPREHDVLILDTIGLLTKVYGYADIAYVGGAFATGLHNTLEPGVFGVPVIIGPHYKKMKEVKDLVALKGVFSVADAAGFCSLMDRFHADPNFRATAGQINASYIIGNKGASDEIMAYIQGILPK